MKKLFTSLSLLLSVLAIHSVAFADISPAAPDPFTDVNYGDEYEGYEAISFLKDEGIISGYSDGSYRPDNEVNRAEFSKITSIAAWNHDPSTDTLGGTLPFSDVDESAWWEPYATKLLELDVVPESIQDYSPWYAKSVTRGEMAILVYNMEDVIDESGVCP